MAKPVTAFFRSEALVTFGSKPLSVIPQRPRPTGRGDSAFAVGSRVIVTSTATPASREIELLDENGLPTPSRLRVGLKVIITAWRPRRSAPPRYRVRSDDGVEGWIDAAHLQRVPPPPPALMMKSAVPPAPVAPAKGKAGARAKGTAGKAAAGPKTPVVAAKTPVVPGKAPAAATKGPAVAAKSTVAPIRPPTLVTKGPAKSKAVVVAKPSATSKAGAGAKTARVASKSPASAARPRGASVVPAKSKGKPKPKTKPSRPAPKRAR